VEQAGLNPQEDDHARCFDEFFTGQVEQLAEIRTDYPPAIFSTAMDSYVKVPDGLKRQAQELVLPPCFLFPNRPGNRRR
jgi:hypothetical protein